MRVAYEALGGRSIKGSLCGWSADRLRANASDGGLKVLLLLGSAQTVVESFKYSKRDRQSLDVPLRPGGILLLYGEGRSWVSAVTGCAPSTADHSPTVPFDFAHLSLLDLRAYARAKPSEYQKLMKPTKPSPRDGSYRWMQCAYTVKTAWQPASGTPPAIELSGH